MTIMPGATEKSLMRRDQLGAGNMEDFVAQADYRLTAEKNILRVSHNGDIEERADTGDIRYTSSDGNIGIDASDNISVDAGKSITIEAQDSITLTCGASVILITPGSITITSAKVDFA